MKASASRTLSLSILLILTTAIILMIIPSTRQSILGTLLPLHRSEALTIQRLELQQDYDDQILTLRLKLKNTSSKTIYPLAAQSALQLQTKAGELVSPHTLPNRQNPEALEQLNQLEPNAQWSGEFSWWLTPEQVNQPLELSWLDQKVLLLEEEGK